MFFSNWVKQKQDSVWNIKVKHYISHMTKTQISNSEIWLHVLILNVVLTKKFGICKTLFKISNKKCQH